MTRILGSPTRRIGPRWAVISGAMLVLALSGCALPPPVAPEVDLGDYTAAPRDLVGVTSVNERHLVRLSGRAGYIDKLERERLDTFVRAVAVNRPESLRVSLSGRASPVALRQVANQLVADGVDPKHVVRADPRAAPPAPPGTVMVAVERAVALLPDCPGWVDHLSAPEDNRTRPNFGCSDVSNFAAMVSDPHELTRAASNIYHDGERGATSVANYRADKVKDLPILKDDFSVIPTAK